MRKIKFLEHVFFFFCPLLFKVMQNLDLRMNPLDSSACNEIKLRLEALGIYLEGEHLVNKTEKYLDAIARNMRQGHQYFAAKELAWEEIT